VRAGERVEEGCVVGTPGSIGGERGGGIRRFADRIPWGWLVTRHHARAVRFARPVVASGFLEEFEPPRMTFGSFLRSFNSGVVLTWRFPFASFDGAAFCRVD
jgi:hypothetical protein